MRKKKYLRLDRQDYGEPKLSVAELTDTELDSLQDDLGTSTDFIPLDTVKKVIGGK